MNKLFFNILLFTSVLTFSQTKKIELLSADISTADESKFPGAVVLIGNVKMAHDGATLDCKRALLYRDRNFFEAVGEVVLEQGDSIIQYSDFASYDGNTKIAKAWGHVEANDKTMQLKTDTLYFDRNNQKAYYPTKGTIRDKKNTLNSSRGTYYFTDKKFVAKQNVHVTNPDNILDSEQLDYYTNTNLAYLYGASTITNKKDSTQIYAEKGFYDSNKNVSYFVKNSKLSLKSGRTLVADSLYYDKNKGFASASNNIKMIDSLNNMITKGNYAEVFEEKDSLFITKRAVAISIMEKDSMYIHGDTLMVTGKPKHRIVRAFHCVKIFKSDLQGKCDSIHSNEITGLTKLFKSPVLWSNGSQITGDSIQFLSNKKTEQLDSLFVYKNAYMIAQDSLDKTNFNQIKGRDMFGKFENNSIKTLLVKGNSESLYYNRNEKSKKLETITKMISSNIEFNFVDKAIEQVKYLKKPEGKTYPPSQFPSNKTKFKGFIWREEERPKTKEDIFITSQKSSTKKTQNTENRLEPKEVESAKEKLDELQQQNKKSN